MYCRYCGKQIPDDSEFCPGCGKPLRESKKANGTIKSNVLTENAVPVFDMKTMHITRTKQTVLQVIRYKR